MAVYEDSYTGKRQKRRREHFERENNAPSNQLPPRPRMTVLTDHSRSQWDDPLGLGLEWFWNGYDTSGNSP